MGENVTQKISNTGSVAFSAKSSRISKPEKSGGLKKYRKKKKNNQVKLGILDDTLSKNMSAQLQEESYFDEDDEGGEEEQMEENHS